MLIECDDPCGILSRVSLRPPTLNTWLKNGLLHQQKGVIYRRHNKIQRERIWWVRRCCFLSVSALRMNPRKTPTLSLINMEHRLQGIQVFP